MAEGGGDSLDSWATTSIALIVGAVETEREPKGSMVRCKCYRRRVSTVDITRTMPADDGHLAADPGTVRVQKGQPEELRCLTTGSSHFCDDQTPIDTERPC